MISVVVPNRNEEANLPRFLQSLVGQTFHDFELIIIDGFSTDASLEIIDHYRQHLTIVSILYGVRNFGAIRNMGQSFARGQIILQSNSDCYFPPTFLEELHAYYVAHPDVMSVTGKVRPMGTSFIAKLAYPAFDLLRFVAASLPTAAQKYRPSGSFISYRREVFKATGGFPEVTTNEDGLFGQRIDAICREEGRKKVVFLLKLWVGHHVKKFEQWGGVRALLFYLYVLGNHFPMLQPLLRPVEEKAGRVFSGEQL